MRKGFILPILVVLILLVAIISVIAYLKLKSATQSNNTQSSQVSQTQPPDKSPADWQTIKGQISKWQESGTYQFEFRAPKSFTTTKPYPHLSAEDSKYYFGAEGAGIRFFAGLMEGPGPLSVLYGRADKTDLCTRPLMLSEPSPNAFEVCDTINVDGGKMLWLLDVHTYGGDGGQCQQDAKLYIARNLGNGHSVFFTPELDILEQIIEPWPKVEQGEFCPDELANTSEVKKLMEANINKIRNATSLSESDNQKLLTLYQIVSTFKFLN